MKLIFNLSVLILAFGYNSFAQEDVARVGQDNVEPPLFTKRIAPIYPPKGLEIKLQGYVILEATLGADGIIRDITVLRSLGKGQLGFEDSAITALEQWEFNPGKVDGEVADVRMTLKIDFVLDSATPIRLLSWQPEAGEGQARPPRITMENVDKQIHESPSFKMPVTISLDAEGQIVATDYDQGLLAVFADPAAMAEELRHMIESYTYKAAMRKDANIASEARIMVNIPLN